MERQEKDGASDPEVEGTIQMCRAYRLKEGSLGAGPLGYLAQKVQPRHWGRGGSRGFSKVPKTWAHPSHVGYWVLRLRMLCEEYARA